jgi:hypothetical protein
MIIDIFIELESFENLIFFSDPVGFDSLGAALPTPHGLKPGISLSHSIDGNFFQPRH